MEEIKREFMGLRIQQAEAFKKWDIAQINKINKAMFALREEYRKEKNKQRRAAYQKARS